MFCIIYRSSTISNRKDLKKAPNTFNKSRLTTTITLFIHIELFSIHVLVYMNSRFSITFQNIFMQNGYHLKVFE